MTHPAVRGPPSLLRNIVIEDFLFQVKRREADPMSTEYVIHDRASLAAARQLPFMVQTLLEDADGTPR